MNALLELMLVFIVLLFMGIPVAYSFILAAAVYVYLIATSVPDIIVAQQGITFVSESFSILAVPLFLLAARLMNEAGMTDRLAAFAMAAVGHVRGGIGHAVVVTNMVMAGMSGSATADAAGIGQAMIPTLIKAGYPPASAAALSAAAATLGPMLPPSIAMVIYSSLSNVSLGRLLLGGAVPGVIIGLFLMLDLLFSREAGKLERVPFSVRKLLTTMRDAFLSLLLPVIILGGSFFGVYTPTEGAAVAVAYGLFLGLAFYRTLTLASVWRALQATAETTGAILLIVMAANAVSWIMAAEGAGEGLKSLFFPFQSSPTIVLLVICAFTVLLGTVLEEATMLVLLTPILAPVVVSYGIDPVQFGVVFVLATMIGLIHPPIGISMFVTIHIAHVSTGQFARAVVRPLLATIAALIVCAVFPQIVLWLPNALLGQRT